MDGWDYDPFDQYMDTHIDEVKVPEFNFDLGDNTWKRTLEFIRNLPVTYNCPIEER